ncbi:acid phosphatase [Panaeolus papilionaceus]|nr:acid phosphatase [Panaeolus papilionaceus]
MFGLKFLIGALLLGSVSSAPPPPPFPPGPPGPPNRAPGPPTPPPGPAKKTTSHVPGIVFDRFINIWLENVDFAKAALDPSLQDLAKQSILLSNFFALTHPSEPNYVGSVGGEYFGMNNDNLNNIPGNVSSIVDLLEDRGISWAEYQEDMPSTGFEGFQFQNQKTGANDYVRKHNPLIIFESVTNEPDRLVNIKNFTAFRQDVANNNLPQWMFITPNMTNDGHDTNVTFAGTFSENFLTPLLKDPHFNAPRTLILLTFDEVGTNSIQNRVFTLLMGSAVPPSLHGTTDSAFYTHYSAISTVEANWGLHTLGRYDVGANVFSLVGQHTQDTIQVTSLDTILLNGSYPGFLNSIPTLIMPVPNVNLVVNGRTVLPLVQEIWGAPELQNCTVYSKQVVPASILTPPVLPAGC